MHLPRHTYNYQKKEKDDSEVQAALNDIIKKKPTIGFWQCHYRLRNMGYTWNHKKVRRVYCDMNLNIPRKPKKRLPARVKQELIIPTDLNQMWSMDFMSDNLENGRRIRLFNVMDDYNRESLAIEVDTSLSSKRIVRVLNDLIQQRGIPSNIRMDNGPEFISNNLKNWAQQLKITLQFIQPGKPTQNAYIERKNGTLRREFLDVYQFKTIEDTRMMIADWQQDYNNVRPHKSLGYMSPIVYADRKGKRLINETTLYPQIHIEGKNARQRQFLPSYNVNLVDKEINEITTNFLI